MTIAIFFLFQMMTLQRQRNQPALSTQCKFKSRLGINHIIIFFLRSQLLLYNKICDVVVVFVHQRINPRSLLGPICTFVCHNNE